MLYYFLEVAFALSIPCFFTAPATASETGAVIAQGDIVRINAHWLATQKKKTWVRVFSCVVVAYLLWCLTLYFLQDWLIFPRQFIPEVSIDPPEKTIEVWTTGENGEVVQSWYLPPLEPTSGPHPVVVFFHGNGELIDFWGGDLKKFREWGMGVLLPEFRGYGRSGGEPGQKEIGADMRKFHDWLCKRPEVDKTRIVYFGRSIGGGVACDLAKDRQPAALILWSSFTSLTKMTRRYLAPPFLLKHSFDNEKTLVSLDCPVCIIHGNKDTVIPVAHGRALHKAAKNSVYHEVAADHNDMAMDKQFWQNIHDFLQESAIIEK